MLSFQPKNFPLSGSQFIEDTFNQAQYNNYKEICYWQNYYQATNEMFNMLEIKLQFMKFKIKAWPWLVDEVMTGVLLHLTALTDDERLTYIMLTFY